MKPDKDPVLAAILSALLPGLGQIYCRRWTAGALFMGSFLLLAVAVPLGFVALGIWIWAIVDARNGALRHQPQTNASPREVIDVPTRRRIDLSRTLPYVVIPALVVLVVVAATFWILFHVGFRLGAA